MLVENVGHAVLYVSIWANGLASYLACFVLYLVCMLRGEVSWWKWMGMEPLEVNKLQWDTMDNAIFVEYNLLIPFTLAILGTTVLKGKFSPYIVKFLSLSFIEVNYTHRSTCKVHKNIPQQTIRTVKYF